MKKRAASIALVLSMILSFTCQAGAVDATAAMTDSRYRPMRRSKLRHRAAA